MRIWLQARLYAYLDPGKNALECAVSFHRLFLSTGMCETLHFLVMQRDSHSVRSVNWIVGSNFFVMTSMGVPSILLFNLLVGSPDDSENALNFLRVARVFSLLSRFCFGRLSSSGSNSWEEVILKALRPLWSSCEGFCVLTRIFLSYSYGGKDSPSIENHWAPFAPSNELKHLGVKLLVTCAPWVGKTMPETHLYFLIFHASFGKTTLQNAFQMMGRWLCVLQRQEADTLLDHPRFSYDCESSQFYWCSVLCPRMVNHRYANL